ncbi:MAG TPA: hypothetical protein VHV75_12250 [Solirubrobacteraceae bacterium]|jgi:hypothetical protein|nr:hypothetical protein [Solirubrobacteraceae bacterium]
MTLQWQQIAPNMIGADDGQGATLIITALPAYLGGKLPCWTLQGDNYGEATEHNSDAAAKAAAAHWIATGEPASS